MVVNSESRIIVQFSVRRIAAAMITPATPIAAASLTDVKPE